MAEIMSAAQNLALWRRDWIDQEAARVFRQAQERLSSCPPESDLSPSGSEIEEGLPAKTKASGEG